MAFSLQDVFALALGYLLGSIPFGLILTRFAGLGDLRAIGSGNIGATNVLRTGRRDLAAATLALDALKATLAVVIAKSIFSDSAGLSAAAGAFLGHLYPVWLRFRGGKGVATYVGGLLGAFWPGALAFAVVWLGIAYGTRYSSAAALGGSLIAPVVALQMGETRVAEVFFALACLLWLRHSQNIQRLFLGQETKIGAEKAG
jgi:acyl phosphate:glycerol-3-phosphate acyltransferase